MFTTGRRMPASLATVFHSVVNGRPNQLNGMFKFGNCFWLELVIKTLELPPNLMIHAVD